MGTIGMIEFLKKYNKKTIDVYQLALEYCSKPFVQWSQAEIKGFLDQLQSMDEQKIIELKRGFKGEAKLDFVMRKISINKWRLIDKNEGLNHELFNHQLGIEGSYYLKNPAMYHNDKTHIERLVEFLQNNSGQLTLNEIGYLVFKDEKALTQPDKASVNGRRILANLRLDINNISYTETIAPFYYPTHSKGNTVLIVENKDTCFSLLRLFKERKTNIKGIFYGEGRAVVKIFSFLHVYGLSNTEEYLYYGDIDQEGFDIYRSLAEKYPGYHITLSKVLYHNLLAYEGRALMNKRNIDRSKVGRVIEDLYEEDKKAIFAILESDGCIPQEALNYERMKVIIDGLQNRLR